MWRLRGRPEKTVRGDGDVTHPERFDGALFRSLRGTCASQIDDNGNAQTLQLLIARTARLSSAIEELADVAGVGDPG